MGLRFQVLFHSPRRGSFRLSLTVLLRYRSYFVFSLGSWSTRIPTGFLVPRRTQVPPRSLQHFVYGDFTLYVRLSQNLSTMLNFSNNFSPFGLTALQPRPNGRFRLLRFRSPLLPKSFLFSLPGVLRWFSSPSLASCTYVFNTG